MKHKGQTFALFTFCEDLLLFSVSCNAFGFWNVSQLKQAISRCDLENGILQELVMCIFYLFIM